MRQKINWNKLALSIALDMVGWLSFALPGTGEFFDALWAPLSAYILMKMYPGSVGKIMGTVEFVEELLPATDFIPTFTLTFLYDTFLRGNKEWEKIFPSEKMKNSSSNKR